VTARLDCGAFILRGWEETDRDSLVAQANNRNVWRNLRDRFPHPYTENDAEAWLALARAQPDWLNWAIVVDDAAVGCVGLEPLTDVHAGTTHIGYWLGEPYWGRGIMTAAVQAIAEHAFSPLGFKRIETPVFAWNPASMRVLEKCGFVREGVMAKSVLKDGELIDSVLYARIAP
jgi:ribosomal-protein-alanine N-acetyltransferase